MLGTRKADRVADALLRGIVKGEISVGSLLPKEAELAEAHGVNRSVVREAIKLLEVHGLVSPRRRRGTEVMDPMSSLSADVIEAMLVPTASRVDPRVLADFLELRSGIDRQMTELAALRRTDADLEALEGAVDRVAAAMHDPDDYDREVDHFVLLVARASQNRFFEMLVHWNQRISRQLSEVFRVARPIGAPHVEALRMLVVMLREKRGEELSALVAAYHDWAIPRMMAAAALRSGTPLDEVAASAAGTQE